MAGNLIGSISGLWHAEAYFEDPSADVSVGQRGTLSILGTDRVGTVVDFGREAGRARARIVAGAGRMDEELAPRDYQGYAAGDIAADCLREAGETVGAGWSLLPASCAHWTRARGPCRDAMRRVMRLAGPDTHWRAARDGSIALYVESWPDNSAAVSADAFPWPQERLVQFWPTDGSVEAGQSVTVFGAARRFTRVEYRWSTEEVTCRGWY